MTGINSFLRDSLGEWSTSRVHVAPEIPENKLNNAVKAFAFAGSPETVIALYDNTVLGSGKDGLLFTGERLIYRASFTAPIDIAYSSIKSAYYKEIKTGKDGKKIERSVELVLNTGTIVAIKDFLECDYSQLAGLLHSCASDFNEYNEEKQLIPVEEMSDTLKVAYVQVIINMALSSSEVLNEKELAEILLLITRLNVRPASRLELRTYLSSGDSLIPTNTLLRTINTECPDAQVKPIHVSLAKDLMNTHQGVEGASLADFPFFVEIRNLLNVSDGEIELIVMAIENDRKMLRPDYTDDQVVTAIKLMSAKAAAVGTPLAAVYLTGSVVGLSASGITSGLAALGMGGLLGLSSMATGIGVAVLIGVVAHTGIRKLTGADQISKSKRRELMLNEVIKQTQATISLLLQDINFITTKLNDMMASVDRQESQLKKLISVMSQMTSAGDMLTRRASSAQNSATMIRCAGRLNVANLKALTREPTKSKLHDFIMGFYEETTEISEKDGSEAIILTLKQDCDSHSLEQLAKAFEAIGYFNAGEVVKSSVVEAASQAKGKLTSFFS